MPKYINPVVIRLAKWALVSLPLVYLAGLQLISGTEFSLHSFALQTALTAAVYLLTPWLQSAPAGKGQIRLNLAWPLLVGALAGCAAGLILNENLIAAWAALAAFFSLGLGLLDLAGGARLSWRWGIVALLTGGLVSVLVVLFNQLLIRFSEEEFFVAVQAGLLFFYWLLLAVGRLVLLGELHFPAGPWLKSRIWPWAGLGAIGLILFFAAGIRGYQASFYAANAPTFTGISENTPFLCGASSTQAEPADAKVVYATFLKTLAAAADKQTPEEGLLFLATGDAQWAMAFHDSLLKEAAQSLFTTPANSVKFDQYSAAQRVYTYAKVRRQAPDLFSPPEQAQIEAWFHAVNRRALTVEWVDWMYGLAFNMLPEGPYENQENGAGLIALLEAENLADPTLSARNQDYLARNPRGWQMRFRNTDDALLYETEWVNNAVFQAQYSDTADPQKVRNSYLWVLLQMLPDGRAPQYNLPAPYTMTSTLLMGAQRLKDGPALWLSAKALSNPKNSALALNFQAGTEQPFDLTGLPPSQGSCLLYGDSGLPNQAAGLAPDKIVFRDGWADNDTYLLLNLRFSGWHRYKGTNTITLIDKGGPLVSEQIAGQDFAWLPKGRSAFRDKRIPRENLNGFQVPRQGLDAALFYLVAAGASPWAQDPPFYAAVDAFSTGVEMDSSQTSLSGWHGWQQTRRILFSHNGIIVIVDDASGPGAQSSAVTWHIQGKPASSPNRFVLQGGSAAAEMVLLPQENGRITTQDEQNADAPGSNQVTYASPAEGRLRLVTVFLTGEWVGANLRQVEVDGTRRLEIEQSGKMTSLNLE